MCGILVDIGDRELTETDPALDMIRHRGPDAGGAISFDLDNIRIGLGHRRLAIIDLSDLGRQPMAYDRERYWLTFNGEIYNYLEIRQELRKDGFSFRSDSDSEVLLAAYAKWGRDCVDRFNGMFSFAIFDRTERTLFLARDRFGIKPLYYWNGPRGFRACSEIKQMTTLDGFRASVQHEQFYHFLNTGDFAFDAKTLWDGVLEVPPGHRIEIDLKSWKPGMPIRPQRWYNPDFANTITDITFEEAVTEFRRLLDQSIQLRLRADVPVGFLLSGGLDSSTLVGIAHRLPRDQNASLRVYSSCYENSPIDERKYIHAMVRETGADACYHFPSPQDIVENFDRVIWHNDIPVVQGSPIPHSLIYRHIKEENDARIVILEGQGADEILGGYGDFHWARLYELLSPRTLPAFLREYHAFQQKHHEPLKIVLRKWQRVRNPGAVRYPPNPGINATCLLGAGTPIPPRAVRREEPSVLQLHLNRMVILRYILHNVDRNSMAQSRETRVPYLDPNLVEFCLRLPSEFKVFQGFSKRVLRKAAEDVLPEIIRNRIDKQGYSSPVPMWASGELAPFFDKELPRSVDFPFVNADRVLADFRRFRETGSGGYFDPLWWRLIATRKWLDMFNLKFDSV